MRTEWDTTPLYKSFDDPAFLADEEQLRRKAQEKTDPVPADVKPGEMAELSEGLEDIPF